jgi:hypothetical protein
MPRNDPPPRPLGLGHWDDFRSPKLSPEQLAKFAADREARERWQPGDPPIPWDPQDPDAPPFWDSYWD